METKVLKIFPGFSRKNEKRYLEKMYFKGYKLIKIKRNTYYFEKVKPENVVFEFDFQMLKGDAEKEYLSLENQWNFSAKRGPYYWFYIIKNNNESDLTYFNNNESKANFIKRQLKLLILSSTFLIFNSAMLLINPNDIFNYIGVLSIVITLFYFYEVIKFFILYKGIKNDILE